MKAVRDPAVWQKLMDSLAALQPDIQALAAELEAGTLDLPADVRTELRHATKRLDRAIKRHKP